MSSHRLLTVILATIMTSSWIARYGGAGHDNPVLRYKLCRSSERQRCAPTEFGNNSTLKFGELDSGKILANTGSYLESLSVSCASSEPLRWRLFALASFQVRVIKSAVNVTGSPAYYYELYFEQAATGRVRCESYDDKSRAAEVYVGAHYRMEFMDWNLVLLRKAVLDASNFILPCITMPVGGRPNGYTNISKAPASEIIMKTPSDKCLQCFPPRKYQENFTACTYCGHFGLSKRFWEAAGAPQPAPWVAKSNLSSDEFRQCANDLNCSAKAILAGAAHYRDCNEDHTLTCSDLFTSLGEYPYKCVQRSTVSFRNFVDVEKCMMELVGADLDDDEVMEFDPRVGFRLKTADYSAVYRCPSEGTNINVLVVPFNPELRIAPSLRHAASSNSSTYATEIECTVSNFYAPAALTLSMRPCGSLSKCEILEQLEESHFHSKPIPDVLWGTDVNTTSANGKVISNPYRQGVIACQGFFNPQIGFATMTSYLFAGLNNRSYLLSDSYPLEAVIMLVRYVEKPEETDENLPQTVFVCTISSFVLFPTIQVTYNSGNGSNRSDGIIVLKSLRFRQFSVERKFTFDGSENISSVTCKAPLRNATQWLSTSINVEVHVNESVFKAQRNILMTLNEYILAFDLVLGFVGLAALFSAGVATKMYFNLQKTSHPGTLGERNHELIYQAESNAPSSCTAYDSELLIDLQNLLGQGQLGRCYLGKYRGKTVAVKVLNTILGSEAVKELSDQLQLLGSIEKHKNVISFIGAVVHTQSARSAKVMLEYSPHGNLLDYLHRHSLQHPSISHLGDNAGCDTLSTQRCNACMSIPLQVHHLCYFCEQIAAGMEFLASKHIIHGNLGARNVIISKEFLVKITDHGFPKILYRGTENDELLPWRWMAPEALNSKEFSTMADMWAFGVTAWEIFTMGQVPYSNVTTASELKQKLESGLKLGRPMRACDSVYTFLKTTWQMCPASRPDFTSGLRSFRSIKNGLNRELVGNHSLREPKGRQVPAPSSRTERPHSL